MKLLLLFVLLGSTAQQALAQETPPDTIVQGDTANRISPGWAFARSLVIPGWGQASAGAYVRGGTFFALQSTSAYMLLKTMARLSNARYLERRNVSLARDSILAAGDTSITNYPDRLQLAVDSVPRVRRARGLVDSREEQRQDWITYTIALTLASGIDAFVAAHLSGLPATIEASPRMDGRTNLELRIPVGRRR